MERRNDQPVTDDIQPLRRRRVQAAGLSVPSIAAPRRTLIKGLVWRTRANIVWVIFTVAPSPKLMQRMCKDTHASHTDYFRC